MLRLPLDEVDAGRVRCCIHANVRRIASRKLVIARYVLGARLLAALHQVGS